MMCGIAGLYNPNREIIDWDDVFDLWDAISDRGKQASGIAWVHGKKNDLKVTVIKAPKTPREMKKFMGDMASKYDRPLIIMMHTRFATQGSVKDNRNNHPVLSGNIVLTHNGVIYNDDVLFDIMKIKPEYEVDTEALAAGLDRKGLEWIAEEAWGSMSLAWLDKKDLSRLNLFTNGQNPLVFSRLEPDNGILVYASCTWHLNESNFRINAPIFAMPFVHYYTREGTLYKRPIETFDTVYYPHEVPKPQQPIRFGEDRSIY
jgi:glutamine phosphoribosylpyrophosphate amidotransferase